MVRRIGSTSKIAKNQMTDMPNYLSREGSLGLILLSVSVALTFDSAHTGLTFLLLHLIVGAFIMVFLSRTARRGRIILAVHVAVVFLFSLFCAYVLAVMDRVVSESSFDFSVFAFDSVKRALILNDFALGVALLVYSLYPQLQMSSRLFSLDELHEAAGRFGRRPMVIPLGLCLCWGMMVAIFFLTPSVLRFPYPENNLQAGNIPPTIRAVFLLIPFGLSMIQFVRDKHRISGIGAVLRVTMYAAILVIGLMGGSRGAVVGLLIGQIVVDAAYCRNVLPMKWLLVLISIAYAVFATVNWPYMRVMMCDVGITRSFFDSFVGYDFISAAKSGAGIVVLSDIPMLGQSLFHFLYVISLIDSGNSLHYQTFWNLIPQQLPDALDGILWVRPVNDNWLLADQFHQAGGFYSYANAYWNGGIVALGLFSAGLAWAIARIELFFKDLSIHYIAAYFTFILLIPVGLYYGIQGLVRGMEFGFVVYWAIRMAGSGISGKHPTRTAYAMRKR